MVGLKLNSVFGVQISLLDDPVQTEPPFRKFSRVQTTVWTDGGFRFDFPSDCHIYACYHSGMIPNIALRCILVIFVL